MNHRVIHIEPAAPPKPALGAPCNGCGVCCLAEPCPLGVLITGRRVGACEALRWHAQAGVYRCGAMAEPLDVLKARVPKPFHVLLPMVSRALPRLARRWISAGSGCDCSLEVTLDRSR